MKTVQSKVLQGDGSTKTITARLIPQSELQRSKTDEAIAMKFAANIAKRHGKESEAKPAK